MIDIFILKIENPGCFWVHVKEGGRFLENETEYKKLYEEMNLFYNKSYRGVKEVKPSVLEEGQVCVVFCQELKSWCRAIVKSIISCTEYYLVECFLVDHAKSVPVKTDSPTNRWDVAAISYFQNLLNATSKVEAKICAIEDDSFDVYLYVTTKGQKVCVNDDLVAKNFACYEMKKDQMLNIVEKQKIQPSLSPGFYSEVISPAFVLWPTLLQAKESSDFKTCGAVSDNAEKIKCKHLEETAFHNGITESNIVVAVPPLEKGVTVSAQVDRKTDSTLHQKTTQNQEETEKDLGNKTVCLKLLQFLNPDPLKASDRHGEKEGFHVKVSTRLPIVLSNEIDPCTTLETAPLFPELRKELLRNQVLGPNHIQSYSWPPIARGCDSVIISPKNDPLVYLPPIITFLQSRSCYVSLPARSGPVALIVCPGWKKANQVFELLEIYTRCSRPLHPILLLLGLNKEEIKSVKIPRGCEVIITTPHNVTRLFERHSLMFLKLCHLVFDEVEVLFSKANEQMLNILDYYKNHLIAEERESAPQQIVAVGSHWNNSLQYLTKEYMNDPYVVITSMEEAAIYGNVQQGVQLCLECDRISALLQVLDFTPTNGQKTLVFTSSTEETDTVSKAVESTSIFCLKIQPGIDFDYAVALWNQKFSTGTHTVLVLTDDCMPALGITDATCVVHFSFPTSPRIFGARLYSMSANFQNSSEKVLSLDQGEPKAKSILLLTEKSACHAAGVLRYLERTEAKIPPELCDFIAGVLEAKEDSKSGKPLCHNLKAYGVCNDKIRCHDRHQINLQIDSPRKVTDDTLPIAGNVTILPLFIVDATRYFGRIVGKPKDQYTSLAEELKEYYKKPSNRISVGTVEKLAVCGLQEENSFHRVQVLEVPAKEENGLFYGVCIKYIDEGRSGQVQNYQLLNLPEKFQAFPPQAVEFIVCRVKPIDNETEWHPKVTRYIHQKIRGKPHEAKIILTLGNTIWVDPMVRVTRLLDLKTSINEYNVRSEILLTGMGVDNPEHTQELLRLFQNAGLAPEKKDLPPFPSEDIAQILTENSQANQEGDDHLLSLAAPSGIQSAFAGDKFYLADMELQDNILKEKSACLLKSDEPVITLAKEKEEAWCSLLKHKNPNVTFDFDHLEDSEQKSPFPVGVGSKKVYQLATEEEEEEDESSEASDTESDDLSAD